MPEFWSGLLALTISVFVLLIVVLLWLKIKSPIRFRGDGNLQPELIEEPRKKELRITPEERAVQLKEDTLDAFRRRIERLFSKIDYQSREDAYGCLSREDSEVHVRAIVSVCDHILEAGIQLSVLPKSPPTEQMDLDKILNPMTAYLYLGLRQDACILLCEQFELSGVPKTIVEDAYDFYKLQKKPLGGFIPSHYDGK